MEVSVGFLDLPNQRWERNALIAWLREHQPKLVGFSVYNDAVRSACEVTKAVKEALPSAVVVWGGSYPTFADPSELIKYSDVDMYVRGEGEQTFVDIARVVFASNAKPLEKIAGLTFRDESDLTVNPARELIKNLDLLPFPDRTIVEEGIQKGAYCTPFTLISSRGCPGNCVFCSSRAFWGGKVRFRSAKNIFDEVQFLVDRYDIKVFGIVDDTFTISPKVVFEFCEYMKGMNLSFSCESRVDVASRELLEALSSAGCVNIQFGIESGVQEVLDAIGKKITLEQIEEAVRISSELGMEVNGSFLFGHYCDTPETMMRTIEFVHSLKEKYGLAPWMSVNTPFPGTPQYINREKYGLTFHTKDSYSLSLSRPHISTKNFSLDDLRAISLYARDILGGEGKWKGDYETRHES
jgi:radical SAM superfamily enzyme YgiQ (UPF0313 family)